MKPSAREILTEGSHGDMDLHARISVLEQQIRDQKENTALALAAADKAIVNAVVVADKAVAKVELAAEKTYLEAAIHGLKEAFSQQIAHQKEMTAQALASADKAVLKAETAAERRFESVNEFRSTLSDQQSGLATKSEVDLRFKALEERLTALSADARELKGRGAGGREAAHDQRNESSDNRGLIFSIITAAIAVSALLFAVFSHLAKT